MLCKKCGADNPKDAVFCGGCGASLTSNDAENMSNETSVSEEKINLEQYVEKAKKLPKKLIIGVAAIILLVIIAIPISKSMGTTVNMDKYTTIEINGYDGYGQAKAVIDWDGIEKKYDGKIKFKEAAKSEWGWLIEDGTPVEFLDEFISLEITPSDSLSNGDEVSYTWTIDPEISKYLTCSIKAKDGKEKVSGLNEVEKFNVFKNLDVTFSGAGPNGEVSFKYNGTDLTDSDFYCDTTFGLSNGDKIIIKLKDNDVDYFIQKMGKLPEKMEMEYEVNGLDEYITQYSALTEDEMDKMQKYSDDVINAYIAKDYDQDSKVDGLMYEGYILCVAKDGNTYGNKNLMYLVYSATLSHASGKFDTTKIYYPVTFKDIMKSGDEYSYDSNASIDGYSRLGGIWYSTNGYTSGSEMYQQLVTANRDRFNIEVSDAIEALSK